jgi:hypothetical protein
MEGTETVTDTSVETTPAPDDKGAVESKQPGDKSAEAAAKKGEGKTYTEAEMREAVRKELQESEANIRKQLYGKIDGLTEQLDVLTKDKEERERVIAEKLKAEEDERLRKEEEQKTLEQKLDDFKQQSSEKDELFKSQMEEFAQKAQERVNQLEAELTKERLGKLRAELISQADGSIIAEMVADPAVNTGLTEEELRASVEAAKETFEKYATKPAPDGSTERDQLPNSMRGKRSPGNTNQRGKEYTQKDMLKVATKEELSAMKDEVLRKHGLM